MPSRAQSTTYIHWWQRSEVIQVAKDTIEERKRDKCRCTQGKSFVTYYPLGSCYLGVVTCNMGMKFVGDTRIEDRHKSCILLLGISERGYQDIMRRSKLDLKRHAEDIS